MNEDIETNRKSDRHLEVYILLFLVSLLVFGSSIAFDWFIFDDGLHIYDNEYLLDYSLDGLLYFWTNGTSKIPITYHYWQFISWLFGNDLPGPFRVFNIMLHSLNSYLVFTLVKKILEKIKISADQYNYPCLIAALLYLTHPVQVESVVWVSSAKGLLASFFSLMAINYYLLPLQTENKRKDSAFMMLKIGGLLACAILSKPSAVIVPFLFILIDIFLTRIKLKDSILRNIHIVLIGSFLGLLHIVEYAGDRASMTFPFFKKMVMVLGAITKYIHLTFFPYNLSFNYGYDYPWVEYIVKHDHIALRSHLIVPVLFVWLIIFFVIYRKGFFKNISFALLFFLISISVNTGIVYYDFQKISTVADRYLNFPLVGIAILFVLGSFRFYDRYKKLYLAITMCLFLLFSCLSYNQLQKWKDSQYYFSFIADENEKFASSIAEPLIADLINRKQLKIALKVFAANQQNLKKGGADFANELLLRFARHKDKVFGNAILDLADRNGITIDSKVMIDYYKKTWQFKKAYLYLEQQQDALPIIEYEAFKNELDHSQERSLFVAKMNIAEFFKEKKAYDSAMEVLSDPIGDRVSLAENQQYYTRLKKIEYSQKIEKIFKQYLKKIITKDQFREELDAIQRDFDKDLKRVFTLD